MTRPGLGVGSVVIRNARILLGQRQGAHGAGTWSIPGGHPEYGELLFRCAEREVQEETGLVVVAASHLGFTEDIMPAEQKHYVTHFVRCDYQSGEPRVTEPDKFIKVGWVPLEHLSALHLFQPLETFIRKHPEIFAEREGEHV